MKKIIIDTGAFIAFFNKNDSYHTNAVDFFKNNKLEHYTTEAVITEVSFILDINTTALTDFYQRLANSNIKIFSLDKYDYIDISKLLTKYSDLPMDYADATVYLSCQKLKTNLVCTVDSDFDIYKLKNKTSFKNSFRII